MSDMSDEIGRIRERLTPLGAIIWWQKVALFLIKVP